MDNEYFASINEVSKRLSIPAHTLRYWEKQFPNAIRPTTGAGGRRYYRAETVARLETIRELLYTRGMTIAGVKRMLRDGTFPKSVAAISDAMTRPVAAEPASAPRAPAPTSTPVSAPVGHVATPAEIDALINLLSAARGLLTQ